MESLENYKKRLLYQCWYRGCKETDRILGAFTKQEIEKFSEDDCRNLEAIMNETDKELWNWLTDQEETPNYLIENPLWQRVKDFCEKR